MKKKKFTVSDTARESWKVNQGAAVGSSTRTQVAMSAVVAAFADAVSISVVRRQM